MNARILRHLFCDRASARRAFPEDALRRITEATAAGEARHSGQVRFVVEASLPLLRVLHGADARQRALELFAQLGVWDTAANNGVLVYLLLADRRVEILADRGINAKVGPEAWRGICAAMEKSFAASRFADGALEGIQAISALLETHFQISGQKKVNELPDAPVML